MTILAKLLNGAALTIIEKQIEIQIESSMEAHQYPKQGRTNGSARQRKNNITPSKILLNSNNQPEMKIPNYISQTNSTNEVCEDTESQEGGGPMSPPARTRI